MAQLFSFGDIQDFKEKLRLLKKKKEITSVQLENIKEQLKMLQRKESNLEKENNDLEKQINKFDDLISYAQKTLISIADYRNTQRGKRRLFKK